MKKRFTEGQIVGFLREADAGVAVKDLCRKHGFSEGRYYLWRSKFGGMSVSDAKRLKELERPKRTAVPKERRGGRIKDLPKTRPSPSYPLLDGAGIPRAPSRPFNARSFQRVFNLFQPILHDFSGPPRVPSTLHAKRWNAPAAGIDAATVFRAFPELPMVYRLLTRPLQMRRAEPPSCRLRGSAVGRVGGSRAKSSEGARHHRLLCGARSLLHRLRPGLDGPEGRLELQASHPQHAAGRGSRLGCRCVAARHGFSCARGTRRNRRTRWSRQRAFARCGSWSPRRGRPQANAQTRCRPRPTTRACSI